MADVYAIRKSTGPLSAGTRVVRLEKSRDGRLVTVQLLAPPTKRARSLKDQGFYENLVKFPMLDRDKGIFETPSNNVVKLRRKEPRRGKRSRDNDGRQQKRDGDVEA